MIIELIPARDLPNAWNALVTMPDGASWLDTHNYPSRTVALRAYHPLRNMKAATKLTVVTPSNVPLLNAPSHFPAPIKPASASVHDLIDSHGAPCAWRTEIMRLTARLADPKLTHRERSKTRLLILSAETQMQLHYENVRADKAYAKTKREAWLDNAANIRKRVARNAKRREAYAARKHA